MGQSRRFRLNFERTFLASGLVLMETMTGKSLLSGKDEREVSGKMVSDGTVC